MALRALRRRRRTSFSGRGRNRLGGTTVLRWFNGIGRGAHVRRQIRGRRCTDLLHQVIALLLRHHGLLSVGASVADAFYVMYYLNRACEIQLAATGGGQPCSEIPAHLSQHACEQLQGAQWQRQLLWQAWLRKLDRLDPSYQQ